MVEIFGSWGHQLEGISDLQDLINPILQNLYHVLPLVPFFSSSPVLRHSLSNGSLSVYDAKDVDSWDLRSIQSKEGIKA
ncbi:CGH_1_collapsed_G0015330.mRNA.1.CDS.1 [Saccharomyces cerevisiae]|nr:CGH_1_collapsed_G0015330.mRNA.1.CDS.1 [Saccharomyces cerevisiae]